MKIFQKVVDKCKQNSYFTVFQKLKIHCHLTNNLFQTNLTGNSR